MKDIDFIPTWYKAGRERKRRYIRYYSLMGAMFALMAGWGFLINGHIAHVNAEVEEMQTIIDKGMGQAENAVVLKSQIDQMVKKSELLDQIELRTSMTAIMGELSSLFGENVILRKLSLKNELIPNSQKKEPAASTSVVQIGGSKKNKTDQVVPPTPSRCKVVLTGIAASPADAALLIAQLEEANYFDQVLLNYSKPRKLKDKDVTEFEVRCFVADYHYVE